MYKRIFVTHVVPENLIDSLPISMAGNYFSWNLIHGHLFDKIISTIPPNLAKIDCNSDTASVNYIQIRLFPNKRIFKMLNLVLENLKLIFSISPKSAVWFYNLTPSILLSYIVLRYFRRKIKCYVIILDHTPSRRLLSLQCFISKLLNAANGIIALSDNKDFTNASKEIIPGIVAPIAQKINKMKQIDYSFLLSGILTENRSPDIILDVFARLPHYTLYITGVFKDETLVFEYAKKYSNIQYLGYLPYKEYKQVLDKVSFSINSRNPFFEENHYNFPSKVIEYLFHNKIVVSTMQYSQLQGINYFYVPLETGQLYDFFVNIAFIPQSELLKYANQSEKVQAMMGVDRWKLAFQRIESNKRK